MIKEKQMNKNKKLANMAMLVALAMIFSYVESLIPINFGIPGMKLGVANLVTVTGMYFLEFPEVFLVVVMRILLTGFLFGNGMSTVKIYDWIKTGSWPVCWNVFQINGNGVMWQGSWPDTKLVNHCPSGL